MTLSTTSIGATSGARRDDRTWRRYGEYLRRSPHLSIEWTDRETGARGWLVINSLRGGAAGGGTRMRSGLTRREVVYLAKTMELKFLFSGPSIGGAKSGIDFDPSDPRRRQVLRRWFQAISPYLHRCYGTGGDLNVDEMLDVIPCCAEVGLSHPQEGVVRGHLRATGSELPAILGSLDRGVKAPVTGANALGGAALPVADLITGYGLARSILHLYEQRGRSVAGAKVAVEGFGAVGGPCAMYLARAGADVVAIADREKAVVERGGIPPEKVEELLRRRVDKCLPPTDDGYVRASSGSPLEGVDADIFVCAAASGTLDESRLERLRSRGVSTIACGANQPFREAKLGATRVQRFADAGFTVIPDVVANCGMARAFSYLMRNPAADSADDVFAAVDETIGSALAEITSRHGSAETGLMASTLEYALDRIAENDDPFQAPTDTA